MKIVYILEVNPYQNSGIIKKVNAQVSFWRSSGYDTKVFVVWPKPSDQAKSFLVGQQTHFSLTNRLPKGFIKNYFNKVFTAKKVLRKLKAESPDMLYIRQNIWYPGLTSILKNCFSILEINSVDSLEFNYYSRLKRAVYFFGKKRILVNTDAVIAVSPDILNYYQNLKVPKCVVSNGIDFKKFKTIKEKKEGEVNLVFVGSGNMEWHGLNRIIELAERLKQFQFRIVGYRKEDFSSVNLENVTFYGWVEKKKLEEIYASSHFGLGSFGNHLVGKSVDSTLKIREYLAYGLPVITGHIDVDFIDSKFVKKVTDNDNNLIGNDVILRFVEKYKSYIVNQEEIKIIKSENKEFKRLSFFDKVVNKR